MRLYGLCKTGSLGALACTGSHRSRWYQRLWPHRGKCIASNNTVISDKRTGKDVEGIGNIIVSNNTSVSTFTAESKENLQ
jgi:hypothetical protein